VFEVRIHGRGGQGVVTAAEMLSIAGFIEGFWAIAIPSFGSERMGAPVVSFVRLHDREIRAREPVTNPTAVVVQDPTLLHQIRVFDGLDPKGYVLINSARSLEELGIDEIVRMLPAGHVLSVPATELALRHIGRPVPNAVLLAGLCAMTRALKLESIEAAIRQKFKGEIGEKNVAAAREAYAMCVSMDAKGAAAHAEAM